MKIAPREAERFISRPPADIKAVLLFGENAGLAQEYADRLTRHIVTNPKDHDRIIDISADQLRKDPARLSDEASQMSMFSPGRRVIRVRDASDGMGELFGDFLKTQTNDTLTIVEAGELTAKASLRAVFEAARNAAAIACYEDNLETLVTLASEIIRTQTIETQPDTLETLVARIGLDRRILRVELDKLALYFGPTEQTSGKRHLTIDLVNELFGQSGTVEADEVATTMALGDVPKLDALLVKAEDAGANASYMITVALRQLHALLAAKASSQSGDEVGAARQRGLWGQSDTVIRTQLRLWSLEKLAAAVRVLGAAEGDTRTTGLPDWPIASRALLHAARLAR